MLGHRALNGEDYLAILKRRWWILAIPAIVFPILAIGITFVVPAEYVSQSLVLIDEQKVASNFVQSVVSEDLNNRLASMKEQILSSSSLQPIVERYNLYASEHLAMDARIDKARKSVVIQAIESDLARANGLPGFRIFFTANDPHTAQQVCGEITSLFMQTNLRLREDSAKGTTDFLKEQIDQAKHTLDDQDAKLAAFQSAHPGNLPGDEATNQSFVGTLTAQLDATTQQIQSYEQSRAMDEALLAEQSGPSAPTAAATQTPQAEEQEMKELLAQEADLELHYQPDYPDVKAIHRKIEDLQKKMAREAAAPPPTSTPSTGPSRTDSASVQAIRARLRGLDLAIQDKHKQQEQLQQQIRAYQGRIESSPQIEAQLKELTRDSETALAFYNSLLTKMNQAQMQTDLELRQQGETFSLLDAANFPDSPTFPKQSVFAMGGVGGGLVFGLLIVALLEYRDTALRTERDIWAFTQLPTLAVIAWSGDFGDVAGDKPARGKRLFGRKAPKKLLADSAG
jgi:polysaccharide chain length determinant protein (PEP-CTERM system associated)